MVEHHAPSRYTQRCKNSHCFNTWTKDHLLGHYLANRTTGLLEAFEVLGGGGGE